jgi:hypothetical protein
MFTWQSCLVQFFLFWKNVEFSHSLHTASRTVLVSSFRRY